MEDSAESPFVKLESGRFKLFAGTCGKGSFGTVCKACDSQSGEIVAIKRLPLGLADEDNTAVRSEVEFMQSCSHPNIVRYDGAFICHEQRELWIVMELCDGGSMSDILRRVDNGLEEGEITAVLHGTLAGLEYLHTRPRPAIHRDIKAGNILVGSSGAVMLADFGVSAQLGSAESKRNSFVGTPFWMAPEMLQDEKYGVAADIWSLGITAIEMAQGRPPLYDKAPLVALYQIPSRPAPKLADSGLWSKAFQNFIAQCLHKNPSKRPSATQCYANCLFQQFTDSEQARSQAVAAMVSRAAPSQALHRASLHDASPDLPDTMQPSNLRATASLASTICLDDAPVRNSSLVRKDAGFSFPSAASTTLSPSKTQKQHDKRKNSQITLRAATHFGLQVSHPELPRETGLDGCDPGVPAVLKALGCAISATGALHSSEFLDFVINHDRALSLGAKIDYICRGQFLGTEWGAPTLVQLLCEWLRQLPQPLLSVADAMIVVVEGKENVPVRHARQKRRNFRASVDPVGIVEMKGLLSKRNRKNKWQRRYFEFAGHYIRYYGNSRSAKLLATIDTDNVQAVKHLSGSCEFALVLDGEDREISLRATNACIAQAWVEKLRSIACDAASSVLDDTTNLMNATRFRTSLCSHNRSVFCWFIDLLSEHVCLAYGNHAHDRFASSAACAFAPLFFARATTSEDWVGQQAFRCTQIVETLILANVQERQKRKRLEVCDSSHVESVQVEALANLAPSWVAEIEGLALSVVSSNQLKTHDGDSPFVKTPVGDALHVAFETTFVEHIQGVDSQSHALFERFVNRVRRALQASSESTAADCAWLDGRDGVRSAERLPAKLRQHEALMLAAADPGKLDALLQRERKVARWLEHMALMSSHLSSPIKLRSDLSLEDPLCTSLFLSLPKYGKNICADSPLSNAAAADSNSKMTEQDRIANRKLENVLARTKQAYRYAQ